MQIIIDQNEERETMIVSADDANIVFTKDEENTNTKEAMLFDAIIDLVNKHIDG